jgi:hypothetical protein
MAVAGYVPSAVEPPVVAVDVSDEVREVMMRSLAAVQRGVDPEDTITAVRSGKWPARVEAAMRAEADEMCAYVDVLLVAMQSPAVVAG